MDKNLGGTSREQGGFLFIMVFYSVILLMTNDNEPTVFGFP